jgi:hypothetical protein
VIKVRSHPVWVLAAAICLSACANHHTSTTSPSVQHAPTVTASSTPALSHTSWILTSVRTSGKAVTIPAAWNARLDFMVGGRIAMSDVVNTFSGTYSARPSGWNQSILSGTLVGWVGTDKTRVLVLSVVRKVSSDRSPEASIVGHQLHVTVPGYELTYEKTTPRSS